MAGSGEAVEVVAIVGIGYGAASGPAHQSTATTAYPSAASRATVAAPMPPAAPVTRATLTERP